MGALHHARRASLLALALATASCFFDSRWLQAQQSQAAAAQRAAPAELHATPAVTGETTLGEAPPKKAARVLKVRARASARYAAQVVDWPHQLADLLDDASQILAPTLGIRLEIAETTPWAPRAGDDDLSALVDELAATDPGTDVDWVIGLVGSLPRVEMSIHQLGMGRVVSKHLVMRSMNDAREYEAIEKNLSRLDEVERRKLHRARKKHKTTTVFLHELGHTLGAPHEPDVTTIMHASYDHGVQGFSGAAAGLMRLTLEHRLLPSAQTPRAFDEALLAHVKANAASWAPAERDEMIGRLEAAINARAAPAPAAPAPPRGRSPAPNAQPDVAGPAAAPLAGLTSTDQDVFERARAAQVGGDLRNAWLTGKPLFSAYPDVYAVQDLRCQIAMGLGLLWDEVQAQCERLMTLTQAASGKAKRK